MAPAFKSGAMFFSLNSVYTTVRRPVKRLIKTTMAAMTSSHQTSAPATWKADPAATAPRESLQPSREYQLTYKTILSFHQYNKQFALSLRSLQHGGGTPCTISTRFNRATRFTLTTLSADRDNKVTKLSCLLSCFARAKHDRGRISE